MKWKLPISNKGSGIIEGKSVLNVLKSEEENCVYSLGLTEGNGRMVLAKKNEVKSDNNIAFTSNVFFEDINNVLHMIY